MAALNCRPGDLAVIIRVPFVRPEAFRPTVERHSLGRIVRCVRLTSVNDGTMGWEIEQPFDIPYIGDVITIFGISDECLRPIRPQADDAIDEMVAKLGPAPMTLTEIREWSEVKHG